MGGRDIRKRVAPDRACRPKPRLYEHSGYFAAGRRSDGKGLACPGGYRDITRRGMEPLSLPAVMVSLVVPAANVAEMVWVAVTLENV